MLVKKLCENAKLPRTPKDGDAGHDLFSCESVLIEPFERMTVSTGISLEIPNGVVGLIWPRSSFASMFGIAVLGGVIDSSYRGEVKVILQNTSDQPILLEAGVKIAQIVFQPYLVYSFEEAEELSETERGENGFGSTGND